MDFIETKSWKPTKDDISETLLYYIFQQYHLFNIKEASYYSFSQYRTVFKKLTYSWENTKALDKHADIISDRIVLYIKSISFPDKNSAFFQWPYHDQLFYERFLYFFYNFNFKFPFSSLNTCITPQKISFYNIKEKKFPLFIYPILIGIIQSISNKGFIKKDYEEFKNSILSVIRIFYTDSSYFRSIQLLKELDLTFIYKYYLDIFLPDELYTLAQNVDALKINPTNNSPDMCNTYSYPIRMRDLRDLSTILYFMRFSSRVLQKEYYRILLSEITQPLANVQDLSLILNQIGSLLRTRVLEYIKENKLITFHDSCEPIELNSLKDFFSLWSKIYNEEISININIDIPSELYKNIFQ